MSARKRRRGRESRSLLSNEDSSRSLAQPSGTGHPLGLKRHSLEVHGKVMAQSMLDPSEVLEVPKKPWVD